MSIANQQELAQARAASAANLAKSVRDFQERQWRNTAMEAAPGLALAAWGARQRSVARANESIVQQQQMNHQMWIQNQLLSGRSMQDIQAQIDAEQLAQQQANDMATKASGQTVLRFLVCIALAIFPSVFWPNMLIWVGIPVVLLIGWGRIGAAFSAAVLAENES